MARAVGLSNLKEQVGALSVNLQVSRACGKMEDQVLP